MQEFNDQMPADVVRYPMVPIRDVVVFPHTMARFVIGRPASVHALETARRELEEEAGMRAQRWESLGDYLSSPGVFTEVIHLFMATGLEAVPTRHEAHEVMEVHWLPFERALQMAQSGELRDGKSLVGVFRAAARLP